MDCASDGVLQRSCLQRKMMVLLKVVYESRASIETWWLGITQLNGRILTIIFAQKTEVNSADEGRQLYDSWACILRIKPFSTFHLALAAHDWKSSSRAVILREFEKPQSKFRYTCKNRLGLQFPPHTCKGSRKSNCSAKTCGECIGR